MDPYKSLANAIVITAANDYRRALQQLKEDRSDQSALNTVIEVEWFLRSGWYRELTAVDGEYLINKLREEIRS